MAPQGKPRFLGWRLCCPFRACPLLWEESGPVHRFGVFSPSGHCAMCHIEFKDVSLALPQNLYLLTYLLMPFFEIERGKPSCGMCHCSTIETLQDLCMHVDPLTRAPKLTSHLEQELLQSLNCPFILLQCSLLFSSFYGKVNGHTTTEKRKALSSSHRHESVYLRSSGYKKQRSGEAGIPKYNVSGVWEHFTWGWRGGMGASNLAGDKIRSPPQMARLATSPLPSRGSPMLHSKGKIHKWHINRRIGYSTRAV